MSSSAKRWKFYLSKERAGRCLVNFFYYTKLDLCYNFGPAIRVVDAYEEFVCPGSEIMSIDSDIRQGYIKLVTADIGRVYNLGICIQGKKTHGEWTYNDGTAMEYCRWLPNEPSGSSTVIRMTRSSDYRWMVSNPRLNCSYMCEYRSQN